MAINQQGQSVVEKVTLVKIDKILFDESTDWICKRPAE